MLALSLDLYCLLANNTQMPHSSEIILVKDEASIRILQLNRPAVRNALSQALQVSLQQHLNEAQEDKSVRAVILTGAGSAFCAGLDLDELKAISNRSTEENRKDSERFAKLLETIYSFDKPVIAALNGHAIAGGAGIASVCDMVIMSSEAKFGYTESKIGFVAALVGIYLVRQVSEKHARDLLLSARLIAADEAKKMGLVNHVTDAANVLEKALAIAKDMTQNSPSSLAMTKKLLAAAPSMGLQEGIRYAIELNALARTTDDLKEGIGSFLEKRKPVWS